MKKIIVLALLLFWPLLGHTVVDSQLKQATNLAYNANFEEAEGILNSYILANPDDPWGYIIRGTTNDWKQKVKGLNGALHQKVLTDYQTANSKAFLQWEKDQENIDKLIALGNSYLYLSKKWLDLDKKSRAGLILKKCRTHLEDAIKKDPTRYEAYLAIGLFNFYASNIPPGLGLLAGIMGISGNESEGLRMMNEAANNENILQADALFMLTYAYGNTKSNYEQSVPYLAKLAGMYPDNPYFKFLKGEYAVKAKKYAQAREDFQQYHAFCSTRPGVCKFDFLAHYYTVVSYSYENKLSEAGPDIAKAMSLNINDSLPRTARLHYMNGVYLKSQNRLEEAKAAFQLVNKAHHDKYYKLAQEELKNIH